MKIQVVVINLDRAPEKDLKDFQNTHQNTKFNLKDFLPLTSIILRTHRQFKKGI